ncbi:MAG: LytR/AlgR family response regulator transcription factor [Mangrovibacterium sp.]
MKITSIIVDDERNGRENLAGLLSGHCPQIKLAGQGSSVIEAIELIRQFHPQLVFLDIEMPGGNGFKLLEALDNYPFEVIFVTAYDHYAIKAIRFSAADYILKPVNVNELTDAVVRVSQRIRDKQENERVRFLQQNLLRPASPKIGLPVGDHVEYVPVDSIIRCKGEGNYTRFIFPDRKAILVAKTLVEFEELLADHGFIRVHKTHLVNLKYVTAFIRDNSGSLILSNGDEVAISRRRKDRVRERLKLLL